MVLVIVSILAVTAVPFAETTYQRRQELSLRETLRATRTAIDAFHEDWKTDRMVNGPDVASAAGYPLTLDVLISGTRVARDGDAVERRYLRRLPENPFAKGAAPEAAWWIMGYTQHDTGVAWNKEDVYDLRPRTDRKALDGTRIEDW